MPTELIKMTLVKSSQILKIGYSEKNHVLAIEFHNGSVYHYMNVPKTVYSALSNSSSVGRYFTDEIKSQPDVYPYTRVK